MRLNDELREIWEFLVPTASPRKSDVIFVFGGIDLMVPRYAAELWSDGYAQTILVTGGAGPLTGDVFDEPEATAFSSELLRNGVEKDRIIIETKATNSGENVEFGMAALRKAAIEPKSALLVAKPFIMRRCVATFALREPGVITTPCPPRGEPVDFIDRPRDEYARRMLAELDRLESYTTLGYIQPVDIPDRVRRARSRLELLLGTNH